MRSEVLISSIKLSILIWLMRRKECIGGGGKEIGAILIRADIKKWSEGKVLEKTDSTNLGESLESQEVMNKSSVCL